MSSSSVDPSREGERQDSDDPSPVCWICREGEWEEEGEAGAQTTSRGLSRLLPRGGARRQRQRRILHPLVRHRCLCWGALGVVHQSCIDRWVTENGHTHCNLCGAAYCIERTTDFQAEEASEGFAKETDMAQRHASFSGASTQRRRQRLRRLYRVYVSMTLRGLCRGTWNLFQHVVLASLLLHVLANAPVSELCTLLNPVTVVSRGTSGVASSLAMQSLHARWQSLATELHCCGVLLVLLRMVCQGLVVRVVSHHLRVSWRRFSDLQSAQQADAEARQWRQHMRALPGFLKLPYMAQRFGERSAMVQEWLGRENGLDALLALGLATIGLPATLVVLAVAFCSPEYHQPPPPPLMYMVNAQVVGVDLAEGEEERRDRGRRVLGTGTVRTSSVRRGHRAEGLSPAPHDSPLRGSCGHEGHEGASAPSAAGAGPEETAPAAAPRALNQARRRRFGRHHRIRKNYYRLPIVVLGPTHAFLQREAVRWLQMGVAPLLTGMTAHLVTAPVLSWRLDLVGRAAVTAGTCAAPTALWSVFAVVPPSPAAALVPVATALHAVATGAASPLHLVALLAHGAHTLWHFSSSLSLYDVLGYWTAGLAVLWLATVLVVRPLMCVALADWLVADRLGFRMAHPLDVAAVDRLVVFHWVHNNKQRRWMGGSSAAAWAADTLLRVLPRECWRACCRCLSCLLLLLTGTCMVVGARYAWETLPITVHPAFPTRSATAVAVVEGSGCEVLHVAPVPLWRLPPTETVGGNGAPHRRGSALPTALPDEGDEERLRPEREDNVPKTPSSIVSTTPLAPSDDVHYRHALLSPSRPRPWAEWALTATLLAWCALFLHSHPWQYLWLRVAAPLYRSWGCTLLRLPSNGPRSVLCDGQQQQRLARWLRVCRAHVHEVHATSTLVRGPPLYHAVSAVMAWSPFYDPDGSGDGGYPHHLHIEQVANRNNDEGSLQRFVYRLRAQQRPVRRAVRAQEREAAALRRQAREPGTATHVGHGEAAASPLREEPQLEMPLPRAWQPFASLPTCFHRTLGDWLFDVLRAGRQAPHKSTTRYTRAAAQRMRRFLRTAWYEVRVGVFVFGLLILSAVYLGGLLACLFAVLMDVVPSCLLLVGLCGVIAACVASPSAAYASAVSLALTPLLALALFAMGGRRLFTEAWRLVRADGRVVQTMALTLCPRKLTVGRYRPLPSAAPGQSAPPPLAPLE